MNKALFSDESRRFAGATIYIVLAPDNRYKFDTGKSVPLSICVTHQRVRRYIATGHKVASIKEYEALFPNLRLPLRQGRNFGRYLNGSAQKQMN